MKNIFSQVGFFVKDFFAHWNTPPKEGYHLPNKEFVSYAVGGMGVQGFGIFTQYFTITMGAYLSVHYQFDQRVVLYTTWIVAILSLFRAPIVGWIIDNTNTKWGRYRPFLLWAGFASVACFWLLAFIPDLFMPADGIPITITQILVIGSYQLIYFIAMTVFGFYSYGRTGLAQVITPNTNERTKLYSVGGVIDSLGPSAVQLFYPLIVNGIYGGSAMTNINSYRIVFPIFGCVMVALSLLMFFGCKERFVLEKKAKKKVGFFNGLKKSFKNKYFLLANISNVLAFGRATVFGSSIYIATYLIGGSQGASVFGAMSTVLGIAFVPGMLFAPLIQKKLGKRNMTLVSFGGSAVISVFMLLLVLFAYPKPGVASATPWLMYVCLFLHNVFAALYTVTGPAMTADYCDYQQWKTGDRLDGFMSQYSSVIITVVGFGTTALVTEILTRVGAKNATDYANSDVMRKVFIIWAIMGIACGVLAMIPYFFWDLTEKKQLQISQDLKKRALQSDLDAGDLAQDQVAEAIALGILTSEAALDMGFSLEDIQQPQSVTEQIDAVVQADTVADDGAQPNSDSSDKE
ncbi:MAG: MFS transporter [Clostridia bacterium]|nr:MFS transporter [Clostridia bacterium]